MPEDKYVPNSAVMGGSRVARKVTFFGRDKIGAEKNTETPATAESSSPAPDSHSEEFIAAPTTIETPAGAASSSAPGSPGDGLPYCARPRALDAGHPERRPGAVTP